MARPWRVWPQAVFAGWARARERVGMRMPMRRVIMEMTTRSSMRVKAWRWRGMGAPGRAGCAARLFYIRGVRSGVAGFFRVESRGYVGLRPPLEWGVKD